MICVNKCVELAPKLDIQKSDLYKEAHKNSLKDYSTNSFPEKMKILCKPDLLKSFILIIYLYLLKGHLKIKDWSLNLSADIPLKIVSILLVLATLAILAKFSKLQDFTIFFHGK